MEKNYASKTDFIGSLTARPVEDFQLPNGLWVKIRGLLADERDEYEGSLTEIKGRKIVTNRRGARARMLAMSVVDQDGQPLFSELDIEQLGSCRADVVDKMYDVCLRLSGMASDVDDEGAREGNSASDQEG